MVFPISPSEGQTLTLPSTVGQSQNFVFQNNGWVRQNPTSGGGGGISVAEATVNEYWSAVASKYLAPSIAWASAAETQLSMPATGTSGPGFTTIRLYLTTTNSNAFTIAGLGFTDVNGVALIPSGITASTTLEGTAANMLDGDPTTLWTSIGNSPTTLDITFSSPVDPRSLLMTSAPTIGNDIQAPMSFVVSGSNDSVIFEYITTVAETYNWGITETRVFSLPSVVKIDFNNGYNFTLTMTGNVVIDNPSNIKMQSGHIRLVQDSVGGRKISFDSNWKTAGGTSPTVTLSGPGVVDVLYYTVLTPTLIEYSLSRVVS